MNRIAQAAEVKAKGAPVNPPAWVHRFAFAFFLIAFLLPSVSVWFPAQVPPDNGWLQAALVITATMATLTSLSRQLPWQNVFLAAGITAAIGAVAQGIGTLTGLSLGPSLWSGASGRHSHGMGMGFAPLLWIITLFNSRGVAKLILRPWKQRHNYGLGVFGLTLVLAVIFDFALESSILQSSDSASHWRGAAASRLGALGAASLLALALATPSLINKKPAVFPPDYHPLVVWTLFNFLFASVAALHHRWLAVAATALTTSMAVVFAVRSGWRFRLER